jgi:hypothetical protein
MSLDVQIETLLAIEKILHGFLWKGRKDAVGTPDYPSGIPVMHTIHDPRKSVVNPHNRVDIKVTSSITVPK